RSYLSEKLVQRFRVPGELYARIEFRTYAQPEDPKPELVIGSRRDGGGLGASPGLPPPWLVYQVHREATSKENALEAFPSIGSGLPGLHGLPEPMPEHHGKCPPICRYLVQYEGMVPM